MDMATPPLQAQATVVAVEGKVLVRNANGQLRAVKVGDTLREGDVIITAAGSHVELASPAGQHFDVGPNQTVALHLDDTPHRPQADNAAQSQVAEAERVIQALNQVDPIDDPTANPGAGLAGGGAQESHNFVRLDRIAEPVTPLAFQFATQRGEVEIPILRGSDAVPFGTATADVTPVNNAPVAVTDNYTMAEDGTPITLAPLTGDTDPDGNPLTVTSINGTALTPGVAQTIAVTGGTVNVSTSGLITFTPDANFNGTVTFPYEISDGQGGTATANQVITVTAVNDPPVAVTDNYTMAEDGTPITLAPLTGDTDPDGNPLTVTSINGTALTPGVAQTIAVTGGTVNVSTSGLITFTPDANFNGTVTFPYEISDGQGGTATANQVITVTAVNDPPVAVTDNYTMAEDGTPITLAPLTGDTDPDGNPLTVTSINGTALTPGVAQTIAVTGGTVNVSTSGLITFTPDANFNGTVTFPYEISDGNGGTATANQVITVTAVNDPPVAVTDNHTMAEDGTPITLAPLTGDTDPDGDPLTVTSINGTALTPGVAQTIAVTGGTVNVSTSGLITFTPDANFNGTVTFPYEISDGQGGTATANQVITVTAVNDPPVGVNDTIPVTEDTPVTQNVLGNDTDPENDPLSISAAQIDTDGDGTPDPLTLGTPTPITDANGAPVGTITVAANGNVTFEPAPNYTGPVPVLAYTPNDGTQDGTPANVTFGPITPVNDPPVGVNDTIPVTEDTPVTQNVLGNDTDPENDPLSISAAQIDTDGDGTPDPLTLGTPTPITDANGAPVGTITVAANGNVTFEPAPNYTGPVPVLAYTPNDGTQDGTPANVTFGPITPVNDPPVGVNDTIPVTEDTPVTQNVLGNDTDPENDPLSISAAQIDTDGDGTPDPLTLGTPTPITDANGAPVGTITVAANGNVTFEPAPNYTGPVPVLAYTPNDGTQDGTPANVTFGPITPVNDPPVGVNDTIPVTEDTPVTQNVLGNDTDPENDPLSISAAQIDTDGDGTPDPLTLGTPTPITDANGAPVGTITVAANGNVTFEPAPNYTGPVPVLAYTPNDGTQDGTPANVTFGPITPVNDPPVGVNDTIPVTEDTPVTQNVLGNDTDPENDPLSISAAQIDTDGDGTPDPLTLGTPTPITDANGAPVGTITVAANGNVTFEPAPNYTGPVPVLAYTPNDGTQDGTPANVTFGPITPVNDPPVGVNDTIPVTEDTPVTQNVLGNDTDPENDPLSISAAQIDTDGDGTPDPLTLGTPTPITDANGAPVGTITVAANGNVTFEPAPNYTGPVPVLAYTPNDGTQDGTPANVTFGPITPVNDPPVGVNDTIPVTEDTPVTQNVLGNDTDPENDPLSISAAQIDTDGDGTPDPLTLGTPTPITDANGAPVGTITVAANGNVTFEPAPNYTGPVPVLAYTPNDGTQDGTPANVTFGPITPVNDPPVGVNDTIPVTEDTPVTQNVLGNDTDPENDPLSISAAQIDTDGDGTPDPLTLGTPTPITDANGAPVGTITVAANGNVTFEPAPNYTGPVPVLAYTPNDGTQDGTPANVTFGPITPVNDPPVGVNDTIPVTEDTPVTQNVLGNDTDPENDPLSISAAQIDTDGDGTPDPLTLGTPTPITDANGAPVGTITVAANGNVTFEPAPNYTGPVPVLAYTPNDGTQDGTPANVTFGPITPVNDPPVGVNDTIPVTEDTPVTQNVLGNDTDPENDPLSISAAQIDTDGDGTPDPLTLGTPTPITDANGAPVGTITVAANGNVTFEPAPNYTGPVPVLAYTPNDGTQDGTPANVTFGPITPVNDPPVGVNDTIPVTEDTPVTQNVLGNDTDPENDPLSISAAQIDTDGDGTPDPLTLGTPTPITDANGAPVGTITVAANGNVTFEPAPNYTGPVPVLAYTPNDGTQDGTPANVTFGPITPVNDPPVNAVPGPQSTSEDSPLVFTGANAITVADPNGDTLTAAIGVTNGTFTLGSTAGVTVTGDGSSTVLVTGTANAINAALNNATYAPTPDYSGPAQLTITTGDGTASDSDNVAITVTPVADTPDVEVKIGSQTGHAVTINNSNVLDTSSGYSVTAYGLEGSPGTITVNTNPSHPGFGVAGSASGDDTELGQSGGQSEKIVISFDQSASSVTVQMAWLNNFGEKAHYLLRDAAGNEIGEGTVWGNTDQVDPAFTLVSNDGRTPIKSIEFTAPGAGDDYLIHSVTFVESKSFPLTITATPTDIDHSETIVGLIVSIPAGATLSAGTDNGDGTWTLPLASNAPYEVSVDPVTHAVSVTGLTMTVPASYTGPLEVVVTATAQEDGTDPADPGATATASGSATTETGLMADPNYSNVDEGRTLDVNTFAQGVLGNDTDLAGHSLTVTGVRTGENNTGEYIGPSVVSRVGEVDTTLTGAYGHLTLNSNGTYTYVADKADSLAQGATAEDVFTYTVSDGLGDIKNAELRITVTGVNDAPVLDLDANDTTAAGANYVTSYTENGPAVAIADIDVRITDVDSTNITSATVTLTNAQAGDLLSAGVMPAGITASVVGNVVTLSGSASLADYQTAIKAISFANGTDNPNTTARDLTVVVSDGTANSNVAHTTINVVAVVDVSAKWIDYWQFNEGSGPTTTNHNPITDQLGTITDAIPHAGQINDPVADLRPTWTMGRNGSSAIQFNGVGGSSALRDGGWVALDHSVTDPLAGLTASKAATLSFWINTTQLGSSIGWDSPSVIGTENNGGVADIQWGVINSTGRIGLGIGDQPGVLSKNPITDGQWHNVVISHDFATGATWLWVDGNLDASATSLFQSNLVSPITSNNFLGFGVTADDGATSNRFLNAALEDVRIYDHILTTSQAQAIYKTELMGNQDSVIANDGQTIRFALDITDATSTYLSGLPDGTVVSSDASHTAIVSGGTADISGWNASEIALSNYGAGSFLFSVTGTDASGHSASQILSVVNSNDMIPGTGGDETLTGNANSNVLAGGNGNDNLSGLGGNDMLIGGAGDDTLNGGAGADVFAWSLADLSKTPGTLASDTVSDFDTAANGDKLDLHDLLQGHGADPSNLTSYLDIVPSGGDTVIRVSSTGGFTGGTYVAGAEDQRITLTGVNLFDALHVTPGNDNALIQALLNQQKLIVD